MKKVSCLLSVCLMLASSVVSAQCSSCAGGAPSFQAMPYSAPVYQGNYYSMPMSYSSAPMYAQPVYDQAIYAQPVQPTYTGYSVPMYSQPIQSGCCGQQWGAPVYSYGSPVSYDSGCGGGMVMDGGMIQGGVIHQDGGMIHHYGGIQSGQILAAPVEGVISTPAEGTVVPADQQPQSTTQPSDSVTPPAPEGNSEDPKPAPENKDGET